jgi:hypothetical protein
MVDFIKEMMENEINMENGVHTDVVFVNNDIGDVAKNEFLNSFNNTPTKNGKIIIETRANKDGSFGAYYDMAFKYLSDYDYFFFCEDDVLIFRDYYIKEFIEHIDSDNNLGFVCLAPISILRGILPIHSGGGCGLTSKEKFLRINSIESVGNMLSSKSSGFIPNDYTYLQTLEIEFTNSFIRGGMSIENHPKFSPLCTNYSIHYGQRNYASIILSQGEKEYIYKVGF